MANKVAPIIHGARICTIFFVPGFRSLNKTTSSMSWRVVALLGAMRNGDVIPYDSDIDILIDINYFSIIKRLSVKRNFNSTDEKIRLVVQPEFTLNIPVDMRKRFDCQGEVCCFFS